MSSDSEAGQTTMTPDAAQVAVRAERLHLADLLDSLPASEWARPSLCDGWSVHDVAAHLTTTTRETPWDVFRAVLRARLNFDRMTSDVAHRLAAEHGPAETIARLRESAESSRRVFLSGPMDPLMDVVVHAQDIARPLGRPYESPADVVLACAAYLAENRLMGGPKRIRDLRLVAEDADWTHGAGPIVRGPAADLLMVVAGRRAGTAGLSGQGVSTLESRLA